MEDKQSRKAETSNNPFVRYQLTGSAKRDLPIVDISPMFANDHSAKQGVARAVGDAATDNGFLYIENHGVKRKLISEVYAHAERFFALNYQEKLRYYIGDSPNHRGFVPVTEKGDYDDETGPRTYEAFDMSLDMSYQDFQRCGPNPLAGPNIWPDLSGFRSCLTDYYNAMRRLGDAMCESFELALGLPPCFFAQHMNYPTSQLRLIHYIPQSKPQQKVDMGAHTDYECFTVLHSHQEGLQILDQSGEWIDAPPVDGAFAVNVGDLLETWTNGRLVSTAHRVVTDGGERYSIPFFMSTDYETEVRPIPSLVGNDNAVKYTPFVAGEHLMGQLMRDFPYLKRRYLNGEIELKAGIPGRNPFEKRIPGRNNKPKIKT
ncbi:MAG: 2OG-Fe(II) oxygenase family protein [Pseudomonadota bacterium]